MKCKKIDKFKKKYMLNSFFQWERTFNKNGIFKKYEFSGNYFMVSTFKG